MHLVLMQVRCWLLVHPLPHVVMVLLLLLSILGLLQHPHDLQFWA